MYKNSKLNYKKKQKFLHFKLKEDVSTTANQGGSTSTSMEFIKFDIN